MLVQPRLLLASSILIAAVVITPVLAQGGLPVVKGQPRDIGQCNVATDFRGSDALLSCSCPPGVNTGSSVWGTDTYTDDSSICRAALHRGVIGNAGGKVTVQIMPGLGSYRGTSRNGVTSGDYGAWEGSYRFVALPGGPTSVVTNYKATDVGQCTNAAAWRGKEQQLSCTCPSGFSLSGSVWGSDTYTDDSDICKAALHAGAIGRSGGRVTVELAPGLSSYGGSPRNGVESGDYGSWGGSYRFVQ